MSDDRFSRRTVLGALAGATASLAGCGAFDRQPDATTTPVAPSEAGTLATRFAPTLYFDRREPWFPTDPRPYASERGGETVVDGFDAFDGYHERYDGEPPDPTVFYHVVSYENSPLSVVQYWFYSPFDQFTTNFHWHDWEALHVFVDTETRDPQLYVASSHSRNVPNNEFLDPSPDVVPRILSELGSHSSALSLNDEVTRFERFSVGELFADITNTVVEGIPDLSDVPLAYGLPRDEGGRLPYLVPEYEGAPIYEHEDLPAVTRDSLVDADVTVRAFDAFDSPPADLPTRETGLVFQHDERENDADVDYELVPTSEVEHLADFTGPQLSYEFTIPAFVEDAVASHITTTDAPWTQERYGNPAADITDPNHRQTLSERYDAIGAPAAVNAVVANVTQAITSDDAPANEGLTTTESPVESVALIQSEAEAVPTFRGIAVVRDVPAGDHRLTVNGAGRAPHSERLSVADGGTQTVAGVDGEIPLVARENATKLEIAAENASSEITRVAVEDDFAGTLYDSSIDGNDAVYVHAGGAYTTEVRDVDDAIGAHRVNPDPAARTGVRIERPETGKAALASFLVDISEETREEVARETDSESGDTTEMAAQTRETTTAARTETKAESPEPTTERTETPTPTPEPTTRTRGTPTRTTATGSANAVRGLERALAAVVEAARRAAERAREGDRENADGQLEVVAERLRRVSERLAEARGDLPGPLSNAVRNRVRQAQKRAEQARESRKL